MHPQCTLSLRNQIHISPACLVVLVRKGPLLGVDQVPFQLSWVHHKALDQIVPFLAAPREGEIESNSFWRPPILLSDANRPSNTHAPSRADARRSGRSGPSGRRQGIAALSCQTADHRPPPSRRPKWSEGARDLGMLVYTSTLYQLAMARHIRAIHCKGAYFLFESMNPFPLSPHQRVWGPDRGLLLLSGGRHGRPAHLDAPRGQLAVHEVGSRRHDDQHVARAVRLPRDPVPAKGSIRKGGMESVQQGECFVASRSTPTDRGTIKGSQCPPSFLSIHTSAP